MLTILPPDELDSINYHATVIRCSDCQQKMIYASAKRGIGYVTFLTFALQDAQIEHICNPANDREVLVCF